MSETRRWVFLYLYRCSSCGTCDFEMDVQGPVSKEDVLYAIEELLQVEELLPLEAVNLMTIVRDAAEAGVFTGHAVPGDTREDLFWHLKRLGYRDIVVAKEEERAYSVS